MGLVSDRCVCLRRVEYSETSQILHLLGRELGIIHGIAKGAHRTTKAGASKFDGGIDLLDLGQAVLSHDPNRDLQTLTEWRLIDGHLPMRRTLRPVLLCQYAAELVDGLFQPNDPHAAVFDALVRLLDELPTSRCEEAFLAFQLILFREAGYPAEFGVCVSCGSLTPDTSTAYFAASHGGVLCKNCESTAPDRATVDGRLIRMIRGIDQLLSRENGLSRLPKLTRHQTDPLNHLLAEHAAHTLGRRLRLPRFVVPATRSGG